MLSDQRLSVTFGAFSCDVIGYDDPFAILTRVVELFGEIAKSNPAFGAGEVPMSDMEKAKLVAGLSDQASRIDELADKTAPNGMRYVVSNAAEDAPEIVEDVEAEDEVVIAALTEETTNGGDLELRDTLEAVGTSEPAPDEEIVALDIAPVAAPVAPVITEDEPTPEAPLELTQALETPVVVKTTAGAVEQPGAEEPFVLETLAVTPEVAETPEVTEVAEAPAPHEEAVLDTAAETLLETDEPAAESAAEEIARTTAAAFAAISKPEADAKPEAHAETEADEAPARQPLRLNMGSFGVEPEARKTPSETPEAKEADTQAERPQRRVTITKLPLRPERPKAVEQPEIQAKHSLTPVQKVEPVVTFGANFGDTSAEAPTPSRAERIRAKMEQRDAEDLDDGENFLFSDVNEGQENVAAVSDDEPADQTVAPLVLSASPLVAPPPLDAPAKKPRRSFANLLGFGKKPTDAPEAPAPKAQAEDDYAGDKDGFLRLRESVAAAMPPAEETTASAAAQQSRPESISEAIDYDDETSPTAFARRVGANSLQDLLEASAVYMDVVEGKSRFSRRDVMQALNQIGADNDYTQEARLKSFRKLLTTGSLVRVDDGMFTVSQATRFGYETRMQA